MIQANDNNQLFNHSNQLHLKTTTTNLNGNSTNNAQDNDNHKPFLARVVNLLDSNQNNPNNTNQLNTAADQDEFLFVEQNDVVCIEDGRDREFYLAKSDQSVGKLVKKNCQILDNDIPLLLCQYLIDNSFYSLYVCFASFVAQDVGDLSITKGDIIVANKQINEHWIQGQVCFDSQANSWPKLITLQQVGTIPLNHCWLLDPERVKAFCHDKICQPQQSPRLPVVQAQRHQQIPFNVHSTSLSSGSSSLHSADYQNNQNQQQQQVFPQPPPRPAQIPRQILAQTLDHREQSHLQNEPQQQSTRQHQHQSMNDLFHKPASILTGGQQDKLKGWFNTVKKKTNRITTRITASLGLISLTRDEEFENHYESFKHIEKTIKFFIKNLTLFVEHFESFLVALQNTSENLSDFYRDKSHQKELDELRKKNKALNCEHFHAFKRTIDRQVIAVSNQLLQKFSGPHQLISKRSAKLLDFDTKTKEMESCRDLEKKNHLRDQYVIAKDLYERMNKQLINELPIFNQFVIEIFKECVLVLIESRKNLISAYTNQMASLLDTPLMLTYTASNVASSILMSCELSKNYQMQQNTEINELIEQQRKDSGQTSGNGSSRQNSANDDDHSSPRPRSSASQLSSEFEQRMAIAALERSSTPLSQVTNYVENNNNDNTNASINQELSIRSINHRNENGSNQNCWNGNNRLVDGSRPAERSSNEEEDHNVTGSGNIDQVDAHTKQPSCNNNESLKNHNNNNNAVTDDGFESVRKEPPKKDEGKRKKKKFQIYIASWPFLATGPNQLSIVSKQPLKLIKGCDECGNPDWSLVQDKKGQLGYVPSSYIKKKE